MRSIKGLLFILAFVWVKPDPAQARQIEWLSVDRDVPNCDAIFIAKIIEISDNGKTKDINGDVLDILKVAVKIEMPISANVVQGQDLVFRHLRWDASLRVPCRNCFISFEFKPNDRCLLFLKKSKTGEYSLLHAEDILIILFSDEMIQAAKSLPKRKDLTESVLDVIWSAFKTQTNECTPTLELLRKSLIFAKRLDNPETRNELTTRLRIIAYTASDSGTYRNLICHPILAANNYLELLSKQASPVK